MISAENTSNKSPPSGDISGLSPAEAVAKLRVSKLVETAGCRDAEVSPDVLAAAEVELLDSAAARSEPFVWVLCRYPARYHMTVGRGGGAGAAEKLATPTMTPSN